MPNFNIFSGARRLGAVFSAAVVLTVFCIAWEEKGHVRVLHPFIGDPKIVDECDFMKTNSVRIDIQMPNGPIVRAQHCFQTAAFGGNVLIPGAFGKEGMMVNPSDADLFMRSHAENFSPKAELATQLTKSERMRVLGWLWGLIWKPVVAAGICWIFMAIVGWIVRGFMGVPSGMDKRPTT